MDDTRPLLQPGSPHQPWWTGWWHRTAANSQGTATHSQSSASIDTLDSYGQAKPFSVGVCWGAASTWASKIQSLIWQSGLSCAGLANLVFSCSAVLIKLTGGRVPVLELCIFRSAISFVFSMVALLGKGVTPLFGHRHNLNLLALRGVSGTLAMGTYYWSLLLLPLADAVTINQLKPPVTAIVAWLFLNEPLGLQGLLGCATAMGGVVVLAHPPFLFGGHGGWGKARIAGTLFGLVSPFFASGVGYSTRRIGKSEPAVVVALWFHMCTLVMMSGPLALGYPQHARLPSLRDTGCLIGVAATSFAAQVLQTRGYQLTAAATAAAMGFTQVVYGNMFGAIFFGEKPSPVAVGGTALILLGVVLVVMRPKPKPSQPAAVAAGPPVETQATSDAAAAGTQQAVPVPGAGSDIREPVSLYTEALEAKLSLLGPLDDSDVGKGSAGLIQLAGYDMNTPDSIMAAGPGRSVTGTSQEGSLGSIDEVFASDPLSVMGAGCDMTPLLPHANAAPAHSQH